MKTRKTMTIKDRVMENIVSKSVKEAGQSINTACVWWLNQPEPPKALKKMRRF